MRCKTTCSIVERNFLFIQYLAQICGQCQQAFRRLGAARPQQPVVSPVTEPIDTKLKPRCPNRRDSRQKLRQSRCRNFAEEGQRQVNRILTHRHPAEATYAVARQRGQTLSLRWRWPYGKEEPHTFSVTNRSPGRTPPIVRPTEETRTYLAGHSAIVSGTCRGDPGRTRQAEQNDFSGSPRGLFGHLVAHLPENLQRIRRKPPRLVIHLIG